MASVIDQLKYQYRNGGMFMKLLYINIGVFLFFRIFTIIAALMKWDTSLIYSINYLFTFHTDPEIFIQRPWSIITYMFLHNDFFHLFGNMLIFFFVGRIFEQNLGSKKLLSTYIIGGIAGALIHFLATNGFPLLNEFGHHPTLGASASVMAVFTAIGFYAPRLEVNLFGVFKVRLILLAGIYLLLDFIRLAQIDHVAHFAHIGGALWGFIMVAYLKQGKDISSWFDRFVSKLNQLFSKRKKFKVVYSKKKKTTYSKQSRKTPPRDDYQYNENKKKRQEKIDKILDKIKDSGYESLSKAEKDFLFDASKNI